MKWIPLYVLLALTLWVVYVAARIEVQNVRAGYFLPRRDEEGGKWHVGSSKLFEKYGKTPPPFVDENAELRDLVSGMGLCQYLMVPLLVMLAVFNMRYAPGRGWRRTAAVCGWVGIVALGLAVYRGYYTSLGW